MSGSLLALRWDGGSKLGGAHRRRFQVMAQFEPDIPYPLRHDLPGFLPPGRVATPTIPRVAQRDYCLARISLTSGVVHTTDLVAMMGRCCFPRDEMNATKRDLEVLR
jgi:hypothetical protein